MNDIQVIGLTGRSGCGKTTVCKQLAQMGIAVIDADKVAKIVVEEGQPCLADIALAFTIMILNPDGTLNRKKLADTVFHDKEKLIQLNSIVFPYINAHIKEELKKLSKKGHHLAVIDAPTLFESGLYSQCALTVAVLADDEKNLNRIILRDHIDDEQARSRLTSQHDEAFFHEHCDIILRNNGTLEDLSASVHHIFSGLANVAHEE